MNIPTVAPSSILVFDQAAIFEVVATVQDNQIIVVVFGVDGLVTLGLEVVVVLD